MKVQINLTITGIGTKVLSDDDLRKAMKLGKNEVPAFDLKALANALHKELSKRKPQACRRSKEAGNLSISVPVKLDGRFLVKTDPTAVADKAPKKTDDEKKAELMKDLGL